MMKTYSTAEVSQVLNFNKHWLQEKVRRGEIKATKECGKYRFDPNDVIDFMLNNGIYSINVEQVLEDRLHDEREKLLAVPTAQLVESIVAYRVENEIEEEVKRRIANKIDEELDKFYSKCDDIYSNTITHSALRFLFQTCLSQSSYFVEGVFLGIVNGDPHGFHWESDSEQEQEDFMSGYDLARSVLSKRHDETVYGENSNDDTFDDKKHQFFWQVNDKAMWVDEEYNGD